MLILSGGIQPVRIRGDQASQSELEVSNNKHNNIKDVSERIVKHFFLLLEIPDRNQ